MVTAPALVLHHPRVTRSGPQYHLPQPGGEQERLEPGLRLGCISTSGALRVSERGAMQKIGSCFPSAQEPKPLPRRGLASAAMINNPTSGKTASFHSVSL